jgi:hypothetical protein
MHLEIFVYLLCRFLGENRIYTIQRENSFTSRALPRNRPFGLVIEGRRRKDWHGDSFPQADSGRYAAPVSNDQAPSEDPACKGQIGKACGGAGHPSCKIIEWTYIASFGGTVKGCYCAATSRGPVKEGKNTRPHPECSEGVK